MKPNFIFIGPDKSGSTWLYMTLSRHPECYVPPCKDTYFFDRYYQRGLGWYLSFFRGASPHAKAIGELCHDYLFSPIAAKRIKKDLPHVKLLVTLRDPVERTFSHYLYLVRSGITRTSFERALSAHPELIRNSVYAIHLSVYFRLFDQSQIKILFFEDLVTSPRAFAKEVFSFLNIKILASEDLPVKVLPASRPRSFWVARLMKICAKTVRDLGFPQVVGYAKYSRLSRILYQPYLERSRPKINPDTELRLRNFFKPSVQVLEEIIGRDLSRWQ